MHPRRGRLIWIAPLASVGFAAFVAAGGWVVQHLWNWLLPSLFGWPVLGYGQALALLALCRILFGNVGLAGGPPSHLRRMRERWSGLTSEERERWRADLRERFGHGPSDPGRPGATSA